MSRLLSIEAKQDKEKIELIEQTTPTCYYRFPETMLPIHALHVMTLIYVNEQLEHVANITNALLCGTLTRNDSDEDSEWDLIGWCSAYQFKIGREAWKIVRDRVKPDP